MLIVFIRTLLLYMIVLLVIRIMGKGELSKMSPFQMVVIFMIAELASIPIESPDVSLITGITAIVTLTFIQVLISFISLKSERFKHIFCGKPSILISNGMIDYKELAKLRITINDLMEQLRLGNNPSLSEVEHAIMEANGDLSIIQYAKDKPITYKDLFNDKVHDALPLVLISDGVLYEKNLFKAGLNKAELEIKLNKLGIEAYSSVFLAFLDSNSEVHVYMKNEDSGYAEEIFL